MKLLAALLVAGATGFGTAASQAQFSPVFLQNASYWRDGKSEVDFYNADFLRDGQHYQTETLIVFTADWVDPNSLTHTEDPAHPGALPVIRMNQLTSVSRGLLLELRSIDALWRMDTMSLARLWLTGSDGLGHIAKSISESRDGNMTTWKYLCDTYRSRTDKAFTPPAPGAIVFYDELPLRVRTIDFSKTSGSSEVQLARTIAGTGDEIVFKPATIAYKVEEHAISVELKQDNLADHFILDRDFPFLLREWKMADGSQLRLKNSLKANAASYSKPGDRERALKDPMLRHPD